MELVGLFSGVVRVGREVEVWIVVVFFGKRVVFVIRGFSVLGC